MDIYNIYNKIVNIDMIHFLVLSNYAIAFCAVSQTKLFVILLFSGRVRRLYQFNLCYNRHRKCPIRNFRIFCNCCNSVFDTGTNIVQKTRGVNVQIYYKSKSQKNRNILFAVLFSLNVHAL